MRIRNRVLLSMLAVLIVAAVGFSFALYWVQRQALESGIRNELHTAALMATNVLPPNYHDRIYNRSSISDREYQKIVDRFNKLCVKADLEYLWSLMILDGKIVFTSATSPGKDAAKRDHAGFLEIHSNPELYTKAFRTMQPQYQINDDKWGRIQAILVPYRDAHGRPYLIGASRNMKTIDHQLHATLFLSILSGIVIIILGLLVFYWLANSLARPIEQMTQIAIDIASGDFSSSLPPKGPLEIRLLGESLHTMGQEIQKRLDELAASRENLNITLHSIGDGVITTDIEGQVTMMNKVAEELTGWSLEDALKHPFEEVFQIINEHTRHRCVNPIEKVLETGGIVGLANHTVLVARDGSERNIADSGAPIRDQHGNLSGTVLVFRDVTEKHQAEQLLQASEERFHSLFDSMSEGVALHELVFDNQGVPIDYRIIDINPQFERVVGIAKSQAVGQVSTQLYNTIDPPYADHYFRVALTHQSESFETYFPPLDKFFSISITPWGVNGFATIFSDITEAKSALADLEEKTAELDRFFSLALDLLCIADTDGLFIRLNRAWEKTLGYNLEDLEGQRFLDFVHPDDLEKTLEAIAILSDHRGIIDFVNRYRCKDGSYRWIEWRSAPYQEKLIYAVARDITDRKRVEEALRISEEKFSKAFRISPDSININRLKDGVYIECNQGFTKITGYSADDVIGRSSLPGDLNIWANAEDRQRLLDGLREKGEMVGLEATFRHKDGRTIIGLMSARIIEINGEKCILTITRDITERKRMETALRESEEKYRYMTENTSDVIWHLNQDYRFDYMSPADERMRGFKQEEVLGSTVWSLLKPEGIDHVKQVNAKRLADEAQGIRTGTIRYELEQICQDGHWIWTEVNVSPHYDSNGKIIGLYGVSRDISDRKQAEEKINQLNAELEQRVHDRTAQLEAANKELEAFAYSVSHDLRAPLRGIDGWSMILKEEYGTNLDEQANQYLDRVRVETQRMGHLIDDLLKLSRITRSEMRWGHVNLSTMAKAIADRLKETQPNRDIEVIIRPGMTARADGALLEIALSNLLNNAFKFTSTRSNAQIEFGLLPGKTRTFFIRDNGVGFDMQYAQRLFGAFQRMHKATEFPGSGIGLATVQRIIHRHGGDIWAESKVDQGTTFFFRLQGGK